MFLIPNCSSVLRIFHFTEDKEKIHLINREVNCQSTMLQLIKIQNPKAKTYNDTEKY